MRTIAKAKNLPELYDVLVLNQDPQRLSELMGVRGQSSGQNPPMNKPNGNYKRTSESDGSGAEMEYARMMGRNQNSEMAVE